ncbi:MAG: transporter substrate-binding domain-containing protein [Lachnospira sp.]
MKNFRKIFACCLVMVMVLLMCTACGSKKKTLKVGMEIGYPPFEYYDTDGTTPIGVDVELAKALSKEMGMEVELVDTAWDGIFAGLSKGDYDCIISAVTITADRLMEFDFSDPYIQNYQCIVSLKKGAKKPASVKELEGLKVGYQEETTSDTYLTDYIAANNAKIETYEYAKVIQVFDELELGRIDAIICDSTVASSYVGEGSIYEITWQQKDEPEEFGVCIKKGNKDLVDKVNTALKKLKSDGTLDTILGKYF